MCADRYWWPTACFGLIFSFLPVVFQNEYVFNSKQLPKRLINKAAFISSLNQLFIPPRWDSNFFSYWFYFRESKVSIKVKLKPICIHSTSWIRLRRSQTDLKNFDYRSPGTTFLFFGVVLLALPALLALRCCRKQFSEYFGGWNFGMVLSIIFFTKLYQSWMDPIQSQMYCLKVCDVNAILNFPLAGLFATSV